MCLGLRCAGERAAAIAAAGQSERSERVFAFGGGAAGNCLRAGPRSQAASVSARTSRLIGEGPASKWGRDFCSRDRDRRCRPIRDVANWVRIRREFSVQALFSTVQYSFSSDPEKYGRDSGIPGARSQRPDAGFDRGQRFGGDLAGHHAVNQHARQPDQAGAFRQVVGGAGPMFGIGGGPAPDQSAYEPLFQSASSMLSNYRGLLGARTTVPEELARLASAAEQSEAESVFRKKVRDKKEVETTKPLRLIGFASNQDSARCACIQISLPQSKAYI